MKTLTLGIIIVFFIIVVALLSLVLSRVKEAGKYKNETIIYLVITALCFGIICLTGFLGLMDYLLSFLLVIQLFILIIGTLHAYLFYKLLPWTSKDKFVWEFLYSIAIACFGAIFFLLVFTFILNLHSLKYVMLSAILLFFVPFFFVQAYNRWLSIPSRIFRKWYYPIGKEIPDPLDSELVSLFVVSFVFHKNRNDTEITTFRAKAPSKMVFGRLFYYFINDYNERHRESPIEFSDQDNHPHGWIFHLKPSWFSRRRYIDPDQIISDNRIRENSVIYCQRIKDENYA
jgi:hypothetical protein